MSTFESDRTQLLTALGQSRAELLAVVSDLTPDQFQQARPGSWSVARVLGHVLHSERLYTQLASLFSGSPSTAIDDATPADRVQALSALNASREAFLAAVAEVTEPDFYRLEQVGHDEYSVLSIIENNTAHDLEHAEQIRKTVGA